MSLAIIKRVHKLCSGNNAIVFTAIRNHFNKDYKPGAYPVTPEQRAAAAKKYEIHPDDYKPFPDDGTGLGDYPDIPLQSGDSKDPFYPWDCPELKRNFNEPLSVEFDLIGEDRYDISYKHRTPLMKQWLQFGFALFGSMGIYYFMEQMKQFPGLLPKQYPYQNVKHYTFESEE